MIRPVRSRSRRIAPVVFLGIIVLFGVLLFWTGLRAFRAQARERAAERAAAEQQEEQVSEISSVPAVATLFSSGAQVGRATRVLTEGGATLEIMAALPPLDEAVYAYHVWLVKDGLADVVDLGPLRLFEGGAWTGTFLVSPETGIVSPALYSRVVIMVESRDGDAGPSGQDVAEGFWE